MVEEYRAPPHASEWGVLQSVTPKRGCPAETLRTWVRQAQRDPGHRSGLTTSERERLKVTVMLTKSWSIYPQDTGLEPVANPPCWASKTAASLNLTVRMIPLPVGVVQ